jgi:transcriptional regulator of aromatic amino acid metabolism
MKLQELDARPQHELISKVIESQTGRRLNFARVKREKAMEMLSRVRSMIAEHRSAVSFHFSERNPDYIRLVMMEQALKHKINEMDANVVAVDFNDPKTKAAMQKAQSGQSLNPEESKLMAAVAAMKKEGKKNKRMVKEASELQTAQVVLASQDMVDRIQGMMEDISEMQFKDLPALTDSIKNDMGAEQAQQFQSQASAALTNLLAAVQAGKTELEGAQGVLTGQAPQVPGADAAGEMPAVPAAAGAEVDADLSLDANLPPEEDEEDLEGSLGRERR